MMKIGFVASSGGHWEELMCLKSIAEQHDSFFVTEEGGQSSDSKIENIYLFPQINRREKHFLWHFIKLFVKTVKIMHDENPDIIISTGALLAFPFCLIAKMRHKKVIYIESFARVYDGSLTGKLVYRFADVFIVQWESMLKIYPNAKYVGGIF